MNDLDKYKSRFGLSIFIIFILLAWISGFYTKEDKDIIKMLGNYSTSVCSSISNEELENEYRGSFETCLNLNDAIVESAIERCGDSYMSKEAINICLEAWFKTLNLEELDKKVVEKLYL